MNSAPTNALASPRSWPPAAARLRHLGPPTRFMAGVSHPLFGLDHILAMVAVGLWAALKGGKALWAWPLAFVGMMGRRRARCYLSAALRRAGHPRLGGRVGLLPRSRSTCRARPAHGRLLRPFPWPCAWRRTPECRRACFPGRLCGCHRGPPSPASLGLGLGRPSAALVHASPALPARGRLSAWPSAYRRGHDPGEVITAAGDIELNEGRRP